MKIRNNISLVILLLLAQGISAQDAIEKYFSAYANDPSFTSIVISSKMFELFAKMDTSDPENKKVKEAIGGLKGIRILSSETAQGGAPKNVQAAIAKIGKEFELLMSIDESNEKVRFYIREEGEKINELLMIVSGKEELFLMSLRGDIDLSKMSSLSKNMNIGGMNYLQNLDKNDKTK